MARSYMSSASLARRSVPGSMPHEAACASPFVRSPFRLVSPRANIPADRSNAFIIESAYATVAGQRIEQTRHIAHALEAMAYVARHLNEPPPPRGILRAPLPDG